MLFYLPLESYLERYTFQMSAPVWGWHERNWRKAGVPYVRVPGENLAAEGSIRTGVVLDATRRSRWAMSQVSRLLGMLDEGRLTNDDTILLDDFWHPGAEALPYAFQLHGVRPRVYAFLWAQSVDQFDFTWPMREWMRHFEKGLGKFLSGIFVACPTLKDLVVEGRIAPADKVHVVGLPFCSEEVRERFPVPRPPRKDLVVFSSRWDREKNPDFFLNVCWRVHSIMPKAKFAVCTSAPRLRSNDPHLLTALDRAMQFHPKPGNESLPFAQRPCEFLPLTVHQGLTKEAYYRILCQAKVQFNCADQDFVSFTLLEASAAGCYPVYPNFRSFPETFLGRQEYLYPKGDVKAAAEKVVEVLQDDDLWTREARKEREWIHSRFDSTWARMLRVMGEGDLKDLKDPFEE